MNRLVTQSLNTINRTVRNVIRMLNSPQDFLPALAGANNIHPTFNELEPEVDPKMEGILLAVPKNRRSLENRRTRRMVQFHFSFYKPKQDLVTCFECGFWHRRKTICPNCYEKVREETEQLRKTAGNDGNTPVDSEIQFLYRGEEEVPTEDKQKQFIRVDRERPSWFPNILMNKAPKDPNQ